MLRLRLAKVEAAVEMDSNLWDHLSDLEKQIDLAMQVDRFRLRQQLQSIIRIAQKINEPPKKLQAFEHSLEQSTTRRKRRLTRLPSPEFDDSLPINAKRDEIADSIRDNQVVIVCGETGSGKSTQLPKICMKLGRGVDGMIGHTQPRRLAARSIAARMCQELNSALGSAVGFKIRFTDTVGDNCYVKLMTDGILLAETQSDRFLDQYDTIILDEAHERSLNIDFLIGYIKRLLPKRRDLRLIITSATIDAERFADHFSRSGSKAPIIEVSGRTYPVEVRYRSMAASENSEDVSPERAVILATEELCLDGRGDILVFLPTERDIRETAKRLRGWARQFPEPPDILPLYARLPNADQNKVFHPGPERRIVLATNVAESSLTVPRIHYVIDTGTARISRYSPRAQVQRLPIAPVSQASANQRTGRCGRIAPGVCIRLFSEDDFQKRDEFTTPEIRRTNLAAVILRMLSVNLGSIHSFPFLDPPRPDAIKDGYETLFELGAIDESRKLTPIGRLMGRMPVDPRISRIVIAGNEQTCLNEILIITAALEVQDPRLRPPDKEQAADASHSRFDDPQSDFMSLLNLWDYLEDLKDSTSRNQFRRRCQQEFLSWNRIREWHDIYRQLKQIANQHGLRQATRKNDYGEIHRALLTGLLSNVALLTEGHEYRGIHDARNYIWPGSSLFGHKPKWLMAAELIETTRRYMRTVAKIDPEWIEPQAMHLVKRDYSDPCWVRKNATVMAMERVKLSSLQVNRRRIKYGKVDPAAARNIFIQNALVEGDFDSPFEFFRHNRKLIEEIAGLAARSRDVSFLISHQDQYVFYDERIPPDVFDTSSMRRWLKKNRQASSSLFMQRADLIAEPRREAVSHAFPDAIQAAGMILDVDYKYNPGSNDDGMTINVPGEALRQLDEQRLEWGVPGLLHEKIVALIKTLSKRQRRHLIPARETAERAIEMMEMGNGRFLPTLASTLGTLAEETISPDDFDLEKIAPHLRVNIRVLGIDGKEIARGRDLGELMAKVKQQATTALGEQKESQWHRDDIMCWDFGELPEKVELDRGGCQFVAYPALVDNRTSAALRLFDEPLRAQNLSHFGVRRLICLAEPKRLKQFIEWLPNLNELSIFAAGLGHQKTLRTQLILLLADIAYLRNNNLPRNENDFDTLLEQGKETTALAAQEIADVVVPIFQTYHQVDLELNKLIAPSCEYMVRDIRTQLFEIMPEDFLSTTPWNWLIHFKRFLKAILHRIERFRSGGMNRDRELLEQYMPFKQRYGQRWDQHTQRGFHDPELVNHRWMLEELRVSLFAQQVGTSIKVSPKRLDKQWELVHW